MRAARGVLVFFLLMSLASCGGTQLSSTAPTPSPGPTVDGSSPTDPVGTVEPTESRASAGPTTAPTDEPPEPVETAASSGNLWAKNPPTPVLSGAAVRVSVADLNVREFPFTSSKRRTTLPRGAIVAVRSVPPVDSEGYIWYAGIVVSREGVVPSLPTPIPDWDADEVFGWFAAGTRNTDYVTRVDPRCTDEVSLRNVAAMTPFERVTCLGDETIEVEGSFECNACTSHIFGEYEPSWLANPNVLGYLWDVPSEGPGLNLRFPPAMDRPEEGTRIRVQGHMSDAAAADCIMDMDYWWPPENIVNHAVPDVVARHLCRQEFVVERYDILRQVRQ